MELKAKLQSHERKLAGKQDDLTNFQKRLQATVSMYIFILIIANQLAMLF